MNERLNPCPVCHEAGGNPYCEGCGDAAEQKSTADSAPGADETREDDDLDEEPEPGDSDLQGEEADGDDEPDEDSITTDDHRKFWQYRKLVLTIDEDDNVEDALVAYMNREQFWPDCYWISDHGNAHRIDLTAAYKRVAR